MLKKILGLGIVSVLMLGVSFASYASDYGWHKDDKGWWFSNGDGTWLANSIYVIDTDTNSVRDDIHYWFKFDEQGYVVVNQEVKSGNTTYYADGDGYLHRQDNSIIVENRKVQNSENSNIGNNSSSKDNKTTFEEYKATYNFFKSLNDDNFYNQHGYYPAPNLFDYIFAN